MHDMLCPRGLPEHGGAPSDNRFPKGRAEYMSRIWFIRTWGYS